MMQGSLVFFSSTWFASKKAHERLFKLQEQGSGGRARETVGFSRSTRRPFNLTQEGNSFVYALETHFSSR